MDKLDERGEGARTDEEDDDAPETEGHLLPNPYLITDSGEQRRDEALRAAERERQDRAKQDRGLADRLRGRIRGRDNG